MKTAIIAGSTGLVGSHLLTQLLENENYSEVIALVRKPLLKSHIKLRYVIFDYKNPDASVLKADDMYCCLGTTLKKAGSKEAQYEVDHDYPLIIAKLGKDQGIKKFLLVSSIGATVKTGNFYLKTKGKLEEDLKFLNFNSLIIFRPSFLLGDRSEFRFGEKIGIIFMKLISPFLIGKLKKYKAIHAKQVATAMINESIKNHSNYKIVENDMML